MSREDYFDLLDSQLREIFTIRKHGHQVPERERFRSEGYMHAARVLGLATAEELQVRMEQIHLKVFGITIAERMRRDRDNPSLDSDYLDIPTIIRKGRAIDLATEEL